MSHHQHQQHDHSSKNLKIAFFLNLSFTIFEIIGGFYVNSVAILSDAVHDLGDTLSLGTSWYLQAQSNKKATKTFSFGFRRLSLLGALINSLVLIISSIYIIYHAIWRIIEPESSNANGMLFFAIVGILVNGYAAWKLSSGKTLNERVVSWHLIEDVLGWVGVLIVAIVLQFKDIQYLDPALSLVISVYILWNVFNRLKETIFLFLQGQPVDINQDAIEKEILATDLVHSIHHTHIWSLDGEDHVFTVHVKLKAVESFDDLLKVKNQLKAILKKYPFKHCTIETELEKEICGQAE